MPSDTRRIGVVSVRLDCPEMVTLEEFGCTVTALLEGPIFEIDTDLCAKIFGSGNITVNGPLEASVKITSSLGSTWYLDETVFTLCPVV